jgi:SAM-dependent methyltransferase
MSLCHLCGSAELLPLIDFGDHPVSKHYLAELSDKQPNWPVKLFFCESCGLSQLVDSCPPEVIYDDYVTLSSWKFQPQVKHEIDIVQKLTGLSLDANIVEIGCNDAMFLDQLSSVGYRNLRGIEPSSDAHALAVAKGFDVVQEFLSPALSASLIERRGKFDLFISRQNLEHISDLKGVIASIDILLKPNGFVLIELPNYDCNLRCQDYSLWEEHVNYFTMDTLRYLLSLSNIEIIHHEILLFSGEGIFVIGQKTESVTPYLDYLPKLRKQNIDYAAYWPVFRLKIAEYLQLQRQVGKKLAVYGAGARAFCLINFAGLVSYIDVILDDQPEKQGKFMPGGRLPIVSSEILYTQGIDICLLAVNTENEDKVIGRHAKWVERGGQFWSVFPPSDRLLPVWKTNDA